MMRRWSTLFVMLCALMLIGGTTVTLLRRAQVPVVEYQIEHIETRDIIKKTVASGAIVPRNEVEVKPRVSGVVDAVLVEPGTTVRVGDLLAEIRVIPDDMSLNNATANLRTTEINLADARREHERNQRLFDEQALSAAELQQSEVNLQLRGQEQRAAADTLRLIRQGAARGGEDVNTQVRATIDGMVLDIPVKVGQSVIESNTFNEGTTVAIVADMGDLIFQGTLDESEVGRVQEGMPLHIRIGALDDASFEGTVSYISPRGVITEGAVQFEIRAALTPPEEVFIRAGVSATADIVLDQRQGVPAINESLLQFDAEGPFVEVAVGEQRFEQRRVELGLSDGIYAEVQGGLTEQDAIKGRPRTGAPSR